MGNKQNKKMDYTKQIDCAAIRTSDGKIWTGKRHHHCLATIIQATGKRCHDAVQGFVTMERNDEHPQGRFIDRMEARILAQETGQITTFCHPTDLFSEDLY